MKLIELTPDAYLALSATGIPPPYEIALLAGLIDEAAEIKRRIGESVDTRRADEKYELTTMRDALTEERRVFEAEKRKFRQPTGRFACFGWLKRTEKKT